jgi:hypothetical protein
MKMSFIVGDTDGMFLKKGVQSNSEVCAFKKK